MPDVQTKTEVDAFGIVHNRDFSEPVDLSYPFVNEWGLEYDKDTGSTHPVISGKIDFVESIQCFKDSCGVDAVLRDISCGKVLPSEVADDGSHGGDFSNPTMLSEMSAIVKKAIADSKAADSEAEAKGLDVKAIKVDGLDLDSYIKKQVDARLAPVSGGDSK